ncbi:NucA/NucB deoxyribonuclease domain-containing protein [Streptomyces phaeochromogenes]|uniref:NucA/NucB deoxyribonuclease domain-containing protein n=1 Tax=Streptomyces phaeochromogenes TaxID=1923 RepID=UPI0027D8A70E|nr:NucA/NucB deoxyribonuclease domain-containing protein [Streptomyces phaeochromogenes]
MNRPFRAALAASFVTCLLVVAAGSVPASAAPAQQGTESVVTLERVSSDELRESQDASRATETTSPDASSASGKPQRQIPQESPDELRERAQLSQKFRDIRAAQNSSRAADLPSSAVECQQVEGAEDTDGLVIDHFTWCQVGTYTITLTECVNGTCSIKGRVGFRLSLLGNGKNGSRDISFVGYLDNFRLIGETAKIRATPLTFDMPCSIDQGSSCDADALNKQTQTVQQWIDVPSMYFHFASPEANAVGTDLLSWYDFNGTASISGQTPVTTGQNGFRCDSASYPAQKQGCVFDLTQELWYDLSVANPDVNETAQHIVDAQEQPETTFPTWSGKTVPGSVTSGQPLNRVFHDTRLRDNNHAQAVRTCKEFFGADYASRGLDCDEYPFQSTTQGAAAQDNRYSARALISSDNQAAGRSLGQFYDRQRVLDADPFYVIVIQ